MSLTHSHRERESLPPPQPHTPRKSRDFLKNFPVNTWHGTGAERYRISLLTAVTAGGRHSSLGSQSAHARAGASQRAPTQHLRTVHTTHCVAIAVPCACDSGSLSSTCRRLRHRLPKLCSAAAIARTASIRHQRHLTRIRSLSRRTRRAVAARVFAHLLGAERERRPPLVFFSLPPRRRAVAAIDAAPALSAVASPLAAQSSKGEAQPRIGGGRPLCRRKASSRHHRPSHRRRLRHDRLRRAGPALLARSSLSSASSERPPGIVRVSQGCVCG